jgi:hypothetical protein
LGLLDVTIVKNVIFLTNKSLNCRIYIVYKSMVKTSLKIVERAGFDTGLLSTVK